MDQRQELDVSAILAYSNSCSCGPGMRQQNSYSKFLFAMATKLYNTAAAILQQTLFSRTIATTHGLAMPITPQAKRAPACPVVLLSSNPSRP